MKQNIKRHVGVPKCLLSRFQNNNGVWVYNLEKDKIYKSNIKDVGTEVGHYDIEAENLLSTELESKIVPFLEELDKFSYYHEKTNFVRKNLDFIEQFIKYQYNRSNKSLELTNKYSIVANTIGKFNYSDLIKITPNIKSNILCMFNKPIIAFLGVSHEGEFVNSSLGFYYRENNDNEIGSCYIPISSKEIIIIVPFKEEMKLFSHYEINKESAVVLNKLCLRFEKALGNGFIFSQNKGSIKDVLNIKEETFLTK